MKGASSSQAEGMNDKDDLCIVCRRILDEWDKIHEHISNHHSVHELRRSAQDGCRLCALFVGDAIKLGRLSAEDEHNSEGDPSSGNTSSPDIQSRNTSQCKKSSRDTERRLGSSIHQNQDEEPESWNWILRTDRLLSSIRFWQTQTPVLHDPKRSKYSFPSRGDLLLLAQKWMKNCNDQHDNCVRFSDNQKLPSRLLQINQQNLQLRASLDLPRATRYATLSHCWGLKEHLKLTKSTLNTFKNQIPQDKLSKTFEDAILIASKLGIDYLWIDSLCIIQDDEEDWRRESELMSMVYGNSYLNIAAAGAVDGSQGCFFQDQKKRINPVQLSRTENGKQAFYNFVPARIYRYCVAETPLASRAWALQERLLAPRTIHFGQVQIFWQCNGGCICESVPDQLSPDFYSSDFYIDKSALSNFWKHIVFIYSECHLTKFEDKLIALSGVIRKIQIERNDECIAGLWKSTIENDLLWRTVNLQPQPPIYVAPSWSWASVCSRVWAHDYYDYENVTSGKGFYAHVLNVSVNPCGSDSLGQLAGGSISLSCQTLIRATFVNHVWEKEFKGFKIEELKIDGRDVIFKLWVAWDHLGEPPGTIYLLPVKGSVEGLVLISTGQEQGQYRRLAIFASSFSNPLPQGVSKHKTNKVLMNPDHCVGADSFVRLPDDNSQKSKHRILNII